MKSFLTLALLHAFTIAYSQVDPEEIRRQAIETGEAVKSQDYETLISHTHPKVLEIIGGREKMISILKKGDAELKQQGISYDKVIIGAPSETVAAGDELHCLVPQTVVMKKSGEKYKIKSETALIGVTKDNGKHWYFIDAVNLNMDNVKTVLPNYNPTLKLPAKKRPERVNN